jgi:hypothetical protein
VVVTNSGTGCTTDCTTDCTFNFAIDFDPASCGQSCEERTARACHAAVAEPACQPTGRLCHFSAASFCSGLQVVAAMAFLPVPRQIRKASFIT